MSFLGVWYQWEWGRGGERAWKGEYSANTVVNMHVNGKMIHVESVPGMRELVKDNDRGGEFKYDIFDIL
jgi:hypothetical protein